MEIPSSPYPVSTQNNLYLIPIHKLTMRIMAAAPSLNLTPEEKRVFGLLFRQADTENIGVVTGEVAVKFFEKTGLEPRVLGEVSASELSSIHLIWRSTLYESRMLTFLFTLFRSDLANRR
jgi:hypothetical protein